MRIALVAPLVSPIREPQAGGAEALVTDLGVGLTRRGHDVDLLAARGSAVSGVRVVDTGVDPTTLLDALVRPGRSGSRRTAATSAAFARAYKIAASREYDVVHNHGFDAAAVELTTELPCPVVHTLHLPPDAEVGAALAAAAKAPRRPIVVAVSHAASQSWAPLLAVDAVIPNGVAVGAIAWSAAPGYGALFAGRLSPEKGALEAIEICRRAEVHLTLVGPVYDSAYAAEVARACEASQVARLEDPVPRPELWRRMARAQVVVCPAMWDEPFGLVAAEAQAAGTPVVGFRRGGLTEVVVDGVTGALVEPGDVDAAVRAVRTAGRHRREACRSHAERSLDIELTVAAYEALYAQA